jgi:thiamine biosynthesis lipoprotein
MFRSTPRRAILALALLCWLPCPRIFAADEPPRPLERFAASDRIMGMDFQLTFYSPDAESANRAAKGVFARIKALNGVFSDYEPESELRKLSATGGTGTFVPVSDDFAAVLAASRALSERSDGAFDITVGPMVKLWRKSRRSRVRPSESEIATAKGLVGNHLIEVDPVRRSVKLAKAGMQLDCGGIAVGYAIDEGLKEFRKHGVTRALIDGSGDVGVSDAPPGEAGWKVAVAPLRPDAPPAETLLLANAAVTTSGDAWQHVEIDGVRYSHIVDVKTGLGLTGRAAVTVVAPTAIQADAYATAICVLGPERGPRLAEETPGMACLFLTTRGDEPVVVRTSRWDGYRHPGARQP